MTRHGIVVSRWVVLATSSIAIAALGCARAPGKPRDDVTFAMQSFERRSADCDTASGPCATIRIQYPEITGAPEPAARDSMQGYVLSFALGRTDDTLRAPSVDAVMNAFLEGFDDFRREFPDAGQPWELERQVTVLPSIAGIFSLEAREFRSTGGAHPNTAVQLASFDVHSGRHLGLGDLLKTGYARPLASLAEKAFRMARELPADTTLQNAGFWFEGGGFKLPQNCAVTADGLRFYFNAYEVGPYVLGPTDFLVTFGEIAGLIREDGPLAAKLAGASPKS